MQISDKEYQQMTKKASPNSPVLKDCAKAFLIGGYYPHKDIYQIQHFINNNFVNMNYNRLCCVSVVTVLALGVLLTLIYVGVILWRRKKI